MLIVPLTHCTGHEIDWYDGKKYQIEVTTGTCLWYTPGYDPLPIRWVLVRDLLGKWEPTAFLSTNQAAAPLQILRWFIIRWSVEVTFQEVRAHLGLETQRQWSDLAIQRTTPTLLGLFSLVTLLAHHLTQGTSLPTRATAWYVKSKPAFSDAIALVRFHLWTNMKFVKSPANSRFPVISNSIFDGLMETIYYAT